MTCRFEAVGWIEARAAARDRERSLAYAATKIGPTPLIAPERYQARFLTQGFSQNDANFLGIINDLDEISAASRRFSNELELRSNPCLYFFRTTAAIQRGP